MNATHTSGFDLARLGFALAYAKGEMLSAVEIATGLRYERPERILRAAVNVGTTSDPTWAGSLPEYRTVSNGFLDAMKVASPFDALAPFAVNVPPKSRVAVSTDALNGSIVGEGINKPVTRLVLNLAETEPQKAIALLVVSDPILRFSPLVAVQLIQRELVAGTAAATNLRYLADLGAAVDTGATFAGSADFLADLHDALSVVSVRGTGRPHIIGSPAVAVDLTMDTRSAFDNMTPNGGTIRGVPFIVSDHVPSGDILVVDPTQLSMDAGLVTLAYSNAAALQMADDPSAGAQNLVSLFQTNSSALRAERWISYEILRSTAVARITSPDYSPVP